MTLTCSAVCCRSQLCCSLTGWQAGWHTVRPLWSCALLAFWNTDWLTSLLSNSWERVDERGRLSCCPTSTYWDWMTVVYSLSPRQRQAAAYTEDLLTPSMKETDWLHQHCIITGWRESKKDKMIQMNLCNVNTCPWHYCQNLANTIKFAVLANRVCPYRVVL